MGVWGIVKIQTKDIWSSHSQAVTGKQWDTAVSSVVWMSEGAQFRNSPLIVPFIDVLVYLQTMQHS